MNGVSALCNLLKQLGLLDKGFSLELLENSSDGVILALSRMGYLNEKEAINAVSKELNIPVVDVSAPEVAQRLNVRELISRCDETSLWKNKLVPLWQEDDQTIVAVSNPFERHIIDALKLTFAGRIKPVLVDEGSINRLLGQGSIMSEVHFDRLESLESAGGIEILSSIRAESEDRSISAETPPIVRLCNRILTDAVAAGASDIHIEPKHHGLELRFRIDGELHTILDIPKRVQSHAVSRFKLLAGMNLAEKRRPQDGIIRVRINGQNIDIRVSALPTALGEKLAMRVLIQNGSELTLSKLGFPAELERITLSVLKSREKMLLVTGPTGSGKSTTLYACLNHLADGTRNIATVEDPIEYHIPKVNQSQVNETIDVNFAGCLRSILRQDPDVIMIGEIRDSETARIAVQAAQTGHLVLSSLHTNDAPSAISRLYDLGVEPYMIASSLGAVIAQRLVRKICPECSGAVPLGQLSAWQGLIDELEIDQESLRVGAGCKFCNGTGFKGRTGFYSFLEISDDIAALIHDKAPGSKLAQRAGKEKYRSLFEAAKELVVSGLTTLEEIRPYLRGEHASSKAAALAVPEVKIINEAKSRQKIERARVLLIEDDADVRDTISMLLEHEMYEVFSAENGKEGLKLLFEQPPDIVLCDLMMPTMNGKEFLVRLKNNADTKKIPVIFLTAVNSEENEVELLDLGASDFIGKGAGSAVLLSRIRSVLSQG